MSSIEELVSEKFTYRGIDCWIRKWREKIIDNTREYYEELLGINSPLSGGIWTAYIFLSNLTSTQLSQIIKLENWHGDCTWVDDHKFGCDYGHVFDCGEILYETVVEDLKKVVDEIYEKNILKEDNKNELLN